MWKFGQPAPAKCFPPPSGGRTTYNSSPRSAGRIPADLRPITPLPHRIRPLNATAPLLARRHGAARRRLLGVGGVGLAAHVGGHDAGQNGSEHAEGFVEDRPEHATLFVLAVAVSGAFGGRGGRESAFDGGQLLEGLLLLGRDKGGGGDEPGDGGGADGDPRVFLGPGLRVHAFAELRLHVLPDLGDGGLGVLRLAGEELGLGELADRLVNAGGVCLRGLRLGRCGRTAAARGIVGLHISSPSGTGRCGSTSSSRTRPSRRSGPGRARR